MSLFNVGEFPLHAGGRSRFLIDCDALTDDDLAALASVASTLVPSFHTVYGIRRGGERFAEAMRPYAVARVAPTPYDILVVDDVLTTGLSMREERKRLMTHGDWVHGLVIFARGRCPSWVTPLFRGSVLPKGTET